MTVEKYRDVAAMPAPRRVTGAAKYDHIRAVWELADRLAPRLFRPGVYRYRTIEDSEAARDRATIERMRELRARRRTSAR